MEPQTPIDVQRTLDRKRKKAEYDKQLKLKRKIDSESLTAIEAEYVYTSCV
jgi:predicted metal-dependent peptidase